MKNDYIPIVFSGVIGFTIAGYLASAVLIPKKPLKDKFMAVFVISSLGLMVGSLVGYTIAENMGDA